MATLIRIDGTTVEVFPLNAHTFTLEELQTAVGGKTELLGMHGGNYMLVNELALTHDYPLNKKASDVLSADWTVKVKVFGHAFIVHQDQLELL